MINDTKIIFEKTLGLPIKERFNLVDTLISCFDKPDEYIDNLWKNEVDDRLEAYHSGKIKSITFNDVLSKYQKC